VALPSLLALLFSIQSLAGVPPQGKAVLEAAASAERSGRYDEAATLYQQFLSQASLIDPSTLIQVRTRLATAYFLLHRYQQSLDAIRPVTSSISSKSSGTRIPAQAWLVDGLDRLELQQLPQAMISLREALKLNPESGTARLALGDSLARSGRLEDAAREYEQQIRRTPSQPDAWYKLGLTHAQLTGRITEHFVRQLPSSVIGGQLAAEDLLTRGDDRGAAKSLSRLLHDYPEQLQVHADLGEALLELGYPQAADNHFHR
jgi:tetratricopeptide (TPR) repeat protein